ncbi:quinone-dependent dihydroorotate dehydrogenase [Deinococcus radiophilus]|uniref:Dihydroorotate dehydrogenase (quinone) n=1 Tax=Deinococcus radiophilus TaxID=32062 RepID=A0A3S0LAL7_9DEIO|nr:quinone-dependent dihydroorotate dehydrogenase [Deinococcus radiophilus]RTR30855.1 quinone-dependent dihydroorotate dehydrogenase [Deinococcus radiophilus]UFA49436.1 quinone-dependent dihydroorotate dehydrogenase [Deinococcus radiophilus]
MHPYRDLLKPQLFRFDPEDVHHFTIAGLGAAGRLPGLPALARRLSLPDVPELRQTLWGREFASPLGLAAGLDKNAEAVTAFGAMGFGFLEVGTVTPLAQSGNERPRLFRLPEDDALINRMGFNNGGMATMRRHLEGPRLCPVWVNIGKNKLTPNDEAASDYRKCVAELYPVADAFVVNVSSPNTPGLRALQAAGDLRALVAEVIDETERQRVRTARRTPPVLVKLAPDLHPADFGASVDAALAAGADGLIISNTTLSRDGLRSVHQGETGGLSGRPLRERSTELVRQAYSQAGGQVPIIGVGGIFTAQDAYEKILAGASLVELYSGLIYGGPSLPAEIARGLTALLRRGGFQDVADAVGRGVQNI